MTGICSRKLWKLKCIYFFFLKKSWGKKFSWTSGRNSNSHQTSLSSLKWPRALFNRTELEDNREEKQSGQSVERIIVEWRVRRTLERNSKIGKEHLSHNDCYTCSCDVSVLQFFWRTNCKRLFISFTSPDVSLRYKRQWQPPRSCLLVLTSLAHMVGASCYTFLNRTELRRILIYWYKLFSFFLM